MFIYIIINGVFDSSINKYIGYFVVIMEENKIVNSFFYGIILNLLLLFINAVIFKKRDLQY